MSEPLRVLMMCPQFRPLLGGYERAAERLSLALAERGHTVVVVAERRDASWPREEWIGAVQVRRIWCLHRARLHTLSVVVSLAVFLLRHGRGFDVIHAHQYGWPAAICVVFGRLARRPVVLKLTATGPDGILQRLGSERFSGPLATFHRRIDACLATSERGAEEALRLGIARERVRRIPNGVDTDDFRPLAEPERTTLRERLGIGSATVVLFVGRLSAEKNPLGLLEAWQRLGPPAHGLLVLAGDGPQREAVAARAAQLGTSVRTLGIVDDPLPWYQGADLFVLPSHYEGLSNSFLEALACGLPVASTRVSGSEDVFATAEVGALLEGPEPAALAAGIAPLLEDPARRARASAAAREVALARFSLAQVAAEVETLYRTLLAGVGR